MPRTKSETSHLLADLMSRIDRVVETAIAEGHAQALHEIRSLVGGRGPAAQGEIPIPFRRRGPGRPRGSKNAPKASARRKSGKPRKNPWAGLTAEQKLARVNAIRKGRGLPPKE